MSHLSWQGGGLDANLTLGNKKSVDITVVLGPGQALTIDVKAVAGKMDWLMGSVPVTAEPNHFVVLVSYEGRFGEYEQVPRCWVIKQGDLLPFVRVAAGRSAMRYLPRRRVLEELKEHENAWHLFGAPLP